MECYLCGGTRNYICDMVSNIWQFGYFHYIRNLVFSKTRGNIQVFDMDDRYTNAFSNKSHSQSCTGIKIEMDILFINGFNPF